mmetsp:Transcript_13576/g.33374  ORF Transcript_13576/g.33374 Transcript_13576/m.33374 type:complete len:236 (+) Transcript_13576:325-1032(+)
MARREPSQSSRLAIWPAVSGSTPRHTSRTSSSVIWLFRGTAEARRPSGWNVLFSADEGGGWHTGQRSSFAEKSRPQSSQSVRLLRFLPPPSAVNPGTRASVAMPVRCGALPFCSNSRQQCSAHRWPNACSPLLSIVKPPAVSRSSLHISCDVQNVLWPADEEGSSVLAAKTATARELAAWCRSSCTSTSKLSTEKRGGPPPPRRGAEVEEVFFCCASASFRCIQSPKESSTCVAT